MMAKYRTCKVLFALLVCAWIVAGSFGAKKPKHNKNRVRVNSNLSPRPDFLRVCTDVKHNVTIEEIKIEIVSRTANSLFARGTLWRDTTMLEKTILHIRKCHDAAEVASCENSHTWRFGTETCTLMEQQQALWSPVFRRFYPPLHCPIKKGIYELRNATVDMTKMQLIPLDLTKYYWRFRLEVFDHAMFTCFEFGGKLVWMKVHEH